MSNKRKGQDKEHCVNLENQIMFYPECMCEPLRGITKSGTQFASILW